MCQMGALFYIGEKMELKKPTTFEEQVELLEIKNILVRDKASCIDFLSKTNYYRLTGYYLPFIRKEEEKCFIPLEFTRVQKIYAFDAELRNLISFAIEKIEVHIRTQLAYYHAHKYGAEGYMLESSFNQRHNHDSYLRHIHACIAENSNTLVVKHHVAQYNGHFPIWAVIEFFSVGMLSYFYRGMKNCDKAKIAEDLYGVNYQTLDSWLRCLTDLRNRCAHYSRLYYWIFPALPKMPSTEKYIPTRRLYAQIYMLKMMYPDREKWNDEFVKPLCKLVRNYKSDISLKHLDFPYRWKSMLKY